MPQLRRLLKEGQLAELGEPTRMVAVTTRWQARREEEQLGAGFHEDLFRASRNWLRLTWMEKRAQKQRWRQDNPHTLWGSAENSYWICRRQITP